MYTFTKPLDDRAKANTHAQRALTTGRLKSTYVKTWEVGGGGKRGESVFSKGSLYGIQCDVSGCSLKKHLKENPGKPKFNNGYYN